MRSLALFGGSFNPPGLHHQALVRLIRKHFDSVVVIPCGPRPDKPETDAVEPVYRAAMSDMAFAGLDACRVDLFDLENDNFTRTWQLEERYRDQGEVWHVVGGDLVAGGGRRQSIIQREWAKGQEIWESCRFAVLERPDYPIDSEDLPPKHLRIVADLPGSSSKVRELAFRHESIEELVGPRLSGFIQRHGLYLGGSIRRSSRLELGELRPLVLADERNPKARQMASVWKDHEPDEPNLILVYGGDGSMLRAIRSHWRQRLPFFGINAGHLGFLLNPPGEPTAARELVCEHLPLLWVEWEDEQGRLSQSLAFNDAWVERATGQTAWLQVSLDGQVRIERLVADGALVATAAGSSSYARAMGASPMPLNTPALLLVGSNVLWPNNWPPAVLPLESRLALTTLDPVKRPLEGYIDGVGQGCVRSMRARISRTASVELAFLANHNPVEKLARIQFPLEGQGS